MTAIGWTIDRAIGHLSHFLHVRGAKQNTIAELDPYLGAAPAVLFPTPAAPSAVARRLARGVTRTPGGGERVLEHLTWQSQHVPLSARYLARHLGEYARNRTVDARWWHPRSGPRRRALVYVHGWLEPGPLPEQLFFLPRLYDALGVDVLHVQLPFHGSRNPRGALFHGEYFWSGDLVRTVEAVRQSCIDARTLVTWLRAEGYGEVGVVGFSMGASIAMVLACLDPTPDYVVPIVGHLKLIDAIEHAPIFWRMKDDLERFGVDEARRTAIFDQIGLHKLEPCLAPERQLWIMARDDAYVRAPRVEEQWDAWGRPPIAWVPGGHATFMLRRPRIVSRIAEFHAALAVRDPTLSGQDREPDRRRD